MISNYTKDMVDKLIQEQADDVTAFAKHKDICRIIDDRIRQRANVIELLTKQG